jgi:hypothetical protein
MAAILAAGTRAAHSSTPCDSHDNVARFATTRNHNIDNMASTEQYLPLTWTLHSFIVDHAIKSTGQSRLYLDRANNEFGIVSHSALPIISMAQYPDDDPIYFQATSARAAAWRTRCKKIALLFEHLQIDLEFTSVDDAQAFVRLIEDIAMSAGNPLFNSHELQQ